MARVLETGEQTYIFKTEVQGRTLNPVWREIQVRTSPTCTYDRSHVLWTRTRCLWWSERETRQWMFRPPRFSRCGEQRLTPASVFRCGKGAVSLERVLSVPLTSHAFRLQEGEIDTAIDPNAHQNQSNRASSISLFSAIFGLSQAGVLGSAGNPRGFFARG